MRAHQQLFPKWGIAIATTVFSRDTSLSQNPHEHLLFDRSSYTHTSNNEFSVIEKSLYGVRGFLYWNWVDVCVGVFEQYM